MYNFREASLAVLLPAASPPTTRTRTRAHEHARAGAPTIPSQTQTNDAYDRTPQPRRRRYPCSVSESVHALDAERRRRCRSPRRLVCGVLSKVTSETRRHQKSPGIKSPPKYRTRREIMQRDRVCLQVVNGYRPLTGPSASFLPIYVWRLGTDGGV